MIFYIALAASLGSLILSGIVFRALTAEFKRTRLPTIEMNLLFSFLLVGGLSGLIMSAFLCAE